MALGAVVPIAIGYASDRLKAPTPRTYGKLPGTIVELQEGIEGRVANLNGRTYNDVQTVELMDSERRRDSGMQGIWTDLLPNWAATPAANARIRQLDPGFQPRAGSGSSAGTAPARQADEAPVPLSTTATPGGIIGTLPLWATLLLAGGIGYVVYKAVKKG